MTQFLDGELGLIAAARALAQFRYDAPPQVSEVLLTFAGIESETDGLPLGEVRQYWSAEALERKDRELADAENFYRPIATEAARRLVRLLDPIE